MATHGRASTRAPAPPVLSFAVDEVAMAARGRPSSGEAVRCELCGRPACGEGACSGLLVWHHEGDVRYDEPPLCPRCATRIGMAAYARWMGELEEE